MRTRSFVQAVRTASQFPSFPHRQRRLPDWRGAVIGHEAAKRTLDGSAPPASRIASRARKPPASPARVPIMKTKARKPRPRDLSRTLDVSTSASGRTPSNARSGAPNPALPPPIASDAPGA